MRNAEEPYFVAAAKRPRPALRNLPFFPLARISRMMAALTVAPGVFPDLDSQSFRFAIASMMLPIRIGSLAEERTAAAASSPLIPFEDDGADGLPFGDGGAGGLLALGSAFVLVAFLLLLVFVTVVLHLRPSGIAQRLHTHTVPAITSKRNPAGFPVFKMCSEGTGTPKRKPPLSPDQRQTGVEAVLRSNSGLPRLSVGTSVFRLRRVQ